ncbi:hypothetical protein HZH66_002620 [Vespula vulgaris]|uniref:Uncharacterized protein n=1 Tax=Vespula vulgaris TaxID=7454 RepID=A0A834KK58_VESVU|nr:hypothetical protein HZH66_002620 [Vespula vulgaris]
MHVGEGDPFILLSERTKRKVNLTVDKIAFEKTRRYSFLFYPFPSGHQSSCDLYFFRDSQDYLLSMIYWP